VSADILPRSARAHPQRFPWATVALTLAVAAALWWHGEAYYRVPAVARPDSPLHGTLDSAGSFGHRLGIAGGAMMLAILLYSLRKRQRLLQRAGALRHWLAVHIFLGLVGPVLVTYHTSFQVGGIVAIAYWSMVVTMLSGIFGRYLYAQLPAPLAEGDQRAVEEECRTLDADLTDQLRGNAPAAALVGRHAVDPEPLGSAAPGRLSAVVRHDLARPLVRWQLARSLRRQAGLSRTRARALARQAVRRSLLRRRLAGAVAMERLFHHWHVFHRPFVWIMFLVIAVHVAVALLFGYTGV
jgi:hypothetical protein